MNSLNKHRRPFSLSATITTIILLGAFVSTFAQAEKEKPKNPLTDAIVGTWEDKHGNDTVRLTFDKDGAFVLKQEESAPDKGTYTLLDEQTVEIKVPNRPVVQRKVKITGDTMQLTSEKGQAETLKRVK
jgi:uncharacterized protein (TIGR03066 family)